MKTPENDTRAPMTARDALEYAVGTLRWLNCGPDDDSQDLEAADALARLLDALPGDEVLADLHERTWQEVREPATDPAIIALDCLRESLGYENLTALYGPNA